MADTNPQVTVSISPVRIIATAPLGEARVLQTRPPIAVLTTPSVQLPAIQVLT